jgi:heme exporter protein A
MIMRDFLFKTDAIAKSYTGKNFIYNNFSIEIRPGDVIAITGENGSGKSTLLKTMAGIINPSRGQISFMKNGNEIAPDEHNLHFGFVAPYVNLYEEFTPIEQFEIFCNLKGIPIDLGLFDNLMLEFNLHKHAHKEIRNFSSGMKQRMKFILALAHDTDLLFLDEPTSNLDNTGIEIVGELIKRKSSNSCGIVIATNEDREKRLCNAFFDLMDYQ